MRLLLGLSVVRRFYLSGQAKYFFKLFDLKEQANQTKQNNNILNKISKNEKKKENDHV